MANEIIIGDKESQWGDLFHCTPIYCFSVVYIIRPLRCVAVAVVEVVVVVIVSAEKKDMTIKGKRPEHQMTLYKPKHALINLLLLNKLTKIHHDEYGCKLHPFGLRLQIRLLLANADR